MKKATVCLVVAMMVIFGSALISQAATFGDAKAMVEKAAAFWKANGKDKTIAEVNNPHGQFIKGDLYVVILDFNGNVLANGGHPGLVGLNQLELKDPNGKYFNKEQIEVARTKGVGTVEMVFSNPVTGKIAPKTNYIRRVEGTEYLILSGAFH